jgi:hypothetical protein
LVLNRKYRRCPGKGQGFQGNLFTLAAFPAIRILFDYFGATIGPVVRAFAADHGLLKGDTMASKDKEVRLEQRALLEKQLEERLAFIAAQGIQGGDAVKDSGVRMIRARIRETDARLKTIEALDRKAEEMAVRKAEKLAAPKKEKTRKKAEEEDTGPSKRQQKKQQKKKKEGKAQ